MKYKIILIFFSIILLAGCNETDVIKEVDEVDGFLLTDEEIIFTLLLNGLEISENTSLDANQFKLNKVIPRVFSMNNNEKLFIYTFADMKERKNVEREILFDQRKQFVKSIEGVLGVISFHAKNALLVSTVSEENRYGSEAFDRLIDIVFKKLNKGKEALYTGDSEYWEAEIVVKYYKHLWEDENGNFIDRDSWKDEYVKIHYKGNVDEVLDQVEVEVEGDSGGIGMKTTLGKDGYITTGSGSSGSIPRKDSVYMVTIRWNNQVETIELKASNWLDFKPFSSRDE